MHDNTAVFRFPKRPNKPEHDGESTNDTTVKWKPIRKISLLKKINFLKVTHSPNLMVDANENLTWYQFSLLRIRFYNEQQTGTQQACVCFIDRLKNAIMYLNSTEYVELVKSAHMRATDKKEEERKVLFSRSFEVYPFKFGWPWVGRTVKIPWLCSSSGRWMLTFG